VHDRQFFYKYLKPEVAKIVIASRKIRWSSPILFNDPFDTTQELPVAFADEEVAALVDQKVAAIVEAGRGAETIRHPVLKALTMLMQKAGPEARKEFAAELRKKRDRNSYPAMQAMKDQWRQMVPSFRILCMSEKNDVPPMWSHYAADYRGMVLEFSAVDEVDSALLLARPVVYQDEPAAIADADKWAECILREGAEFVDLLRDFQYTKKTAWAYEKEWRVSQMGSRSGETAAFADYGFNPMELTGVYLGPRSSQADKDDVRALLIGDLSHVKTYEASLDQRRLQINFKMVGNEAV
jgi:cell division protein ZapA (FtsZ GTPase activity inhibitor)